MFTGKDVQRGSFLFWNFPRFCFLVSAIISLSYSQSDPGYTYRFSGGSEYFDLFRQQSSISRSTAFSKSSFATFSAVSGSDSVSISFQTAERYAALDQLNSKFSAVFKQSEQNIDLRYSGSFFFFGYGCGIGTTINTPHRELNYSISITADPFNEMLSGGIAFDHSPIHYNSSLLFQDFLVPVEESPHSTNISYSIQSKPFNDLSMTIEYYDMESKKNPSSDLYDVSSNYTAIGKKLQLHYSLSERSFLSTEIGTDEVRTELLFSKNALSFGDLVKGSGKFSRYLVKLQSEAFTLPFTVQYSFDQLSLSGIGHFESWPFTTLAASIIANRLNYQLSGFIKHHSLETNTTIYFGSSSLSPTLSYHRILPDAALEHWEPEFLVFGVKNFTRNPISISDVHLLGIGLRYQIPFNDLTLTAFAEQYVPLSITYRPRTPSSSTSPSGQTGASSPPTTDGGRRAGLFFTIRL